MSARAQGVNRACEYSLQVSIRDTSVEKVSKTMRFSSYVMEVCSRLRDSYMYVAYSFCSLRGCSQLPVWQTGSTGLPAPAMRLSQQSSEPVSESLQIIFIFCSHVLQQLLTYSEDEFGTTQHVVYD